MTTSDWDDRSDIQAAGMDLELVIYHPAFLTPRSYKFPEHNFYVHDFMFVIIVVA